MKSLEIKGRTFWSEGSPKFLLADTCWSAFTNITINDWEYYLQQRKMQGFNVIQVNMLWQWDSSGTDLNMLPFTKKSDGSFDFSQRNTAYFERAEQMVAIAEKYDIRLALVLLWCNYLPNTWATKLRKTSIFPKDLVEEYVSFVVNKFDKYNPIYIISGDTDFPDEETIDYYELALNQVKKLAPAAIATLHIRGREMDLPQRLQENQGLDFYMFQSGHNSSHQDMSYLLAENFYGKTPVKPAINSEPCYEQMGYSRRVYGRFSQFDVRKAAWQSIVAGAATGVTYGAHGIWSWHDDSKKFDTTVGEAFETPCDWRDALLFQGAWDYSYLKTVIENYQLFDLAPRNDLLINQTSEIRVAENDNYLVVSVPVNIDVKLKANYPNRKIIMHDLGRQQVRLHTMKISDEVTIIPMHRAIQDVLYIIEK